MPYIAFCSDGGDKRAERHGALEAHLDYIRSILDRVAVAGPWRTEASAPPGGSCFIYHTDDRSEAESLLHNDPYYRAGVYDEVTLVPFKGVAGTWVGGLKLPTGS